MALSKKSKSHVFDNFDSRPKSPESPPPPYKGGTMDTELMDLLVIGPDPSISTNLIYANANKSLRREFIDDCFRAIPPFMASKGSG